MCRDILHSGEKDSTCQHHRSCHLLISLHAVKDQNQAILPKMWTIRDGQSSSVRPKRVLVKNWGDHLKYTVSLKLEFTGGTVVKNLPANAGDTGSIPQPWRSPEEEMATHSSLFTWRIPRREEPGGRQSMGSPRVGHDWVAEHARAQRIPPAGTAVGAEDQSWRTGQSKQDRALSRGGFWTEKRLSLGLDVWGQVERSKEKNWQFGTGSENSEIASEERACGLQGVTGGARPSKPGSARSHPFIPRSPAEMNGKKREPATRSEWQGKKWDFSPMYLFILFYFIN